MHVNQLERERRTHGVLVASAGTETKDYMAMKLDKHN